MPSTAGARVVERIRLGGVRVGLRAGTRQVITVNRRSGYRATVTYWVRRDGQWVKRRRTSSGRIGYGGLVKASQRKQWTGTTPIGSFTMTETFGNHRRTPRARMPFHRVRAGDYWVQDNRSAYYNTLRNKRAGGFRWWLAPSVPNSSERLRDYGRQYRWSVVIDFNRPPNAVRRRGSGIFLHVNGDGATAGCVSARRRFIRWTMNHLAPRKVPVIAIGR
ncbi:L,D-peptidoglycan transpeptidase YkuD (ErfK/YbiS/YcfS/YnhG family) [Mumia flava]|uniref:L,D-peptidoglycan transpeptidase YkuD (ErfK/YbiS/YcfS/YnhG family) n=1 Tax=Mumia flava TaxID=1348852 RepID=A0A2M9BIV5_9ACTN|nr:L,D-transpeptidase family protein [Mumia flava]PJJ57852.1 L,D-peptidoglycan transpeptidase YkuD (ErfK/YbiS/YcfS/YnhG family) [Mumia flava]